jgi:PPE-repeat protein
VALGIYAALPPEVNVGRLLAGAGPGPMFAVAAGYTAIAQAAESLAAASEAQVNSLMTTWRGVSADRAVPSFRRHVAWLHELAARAEATAAQATTVANSYTTAVASSPTLVELAVNRVTLIALIATNILGQNTPAITVTEADYMRMWGQAAGAMSAYDAETTANTSALTVPPPAPDISSVSGAMSSLLGPLSSLTSLASNADDQSTDEEATDRGPDSELGASLTPGFLGTVPHSTVRAELLGGGPNLAVPALTLGSVDEMSGERTGFLLPAGWSPAAAGAPGGLGADPIGTRVAGVTPTPLSTAGSAVGPLGAAPMGVAAPVSSTRASSPDAVLASGWRQQIPTAVIDVGGVEEEV